MGEQLRWTHVSDCEWESRCITFYDPRAVFIIVETCIVKWTATMMTGESRCFLFWKYNNLYLYSHYEMYHSTCQQATDFLNIIEMEAIIAFFTNKCVCTSEDRDVYLFAQLGIFQFDERRFIFGVFTESSSLFLRADLTYRTISMLTQSLLFLIGPSPRIQLPEDLENNQSLVEVRVARSWTPCLALAS